MARPDQVFHIREREKELGFAFAVKAGGLLYASGTCGQETDGTPVGPGDMAAQL